MRMEFSPATCAVEERLKAARQARDAGTDRSPERGCSAPEIRGWQRPEAYSAPEWERSDIVQRPCGFLRHEGMPGFAGVQTVSVQGVKILPAVEGRRD